MGYVTLDRLRERLRVTDTNDDARLSQLIDAASAMIDQDTGQTFGQATATKTFVPESPYVLRVPPLISVTTLKTDDDDDGTFETTWSASDYELDGFGDFLGSSGTDPYEMIRAVGSRSFPIPSPTGRQRLVQITGSWGYSTTPAPIVEATMLLVSRLWHRAGSPLGSQPIGDGGVVFVRSLDPDYQKLISPFTRYGIA